MIPSETKLNKGAGMKVSKGLLLPETTVQLSYVAYGPLMIYTVMIVVNCSY